MKCFALIRAVLICFYGISTFGFSCADVQFQILLQFFVSLNNNVTFLISWSGFCFSNSNYFKSTMSSHQMGKSFDIKFFCLTLHQLKFFKKRFAMSSVLVTIRGRLVIWNLESTSYKFQ